MMREDLRRVPAERAGPLIPGVSLRRNLAWILAGNVVYAACQWGMLVVVARRGSPKMVGDFAFALALTAPIMIFATLNLRAAQVTDQRSEFSFADYVQLRVLCLAGALLVIAAILDLGGFDRATVVVVTMVALAKSFDALSDAIYGLLQKHERMSRIAMSRIMQGLLQLAALGCAIVATGSLFAATAAMAAMSLAVTVLFDVRSVRILGTLLSHGHRPSFRVAVRPRRRALARLLLLSLPLGAAAALDSVNANIPRYVLASSSGREALGFYAAIAYFLTAQGTVLSAVADAARPRLARHFLESREDFARLTGQLAIIASGGALLGLLLVQVAGPEILRLVYGPEYASQAALFSWIMVAAIPWQLAGVAGTALSAARSFRALSASFFLMTVVTAAAALLLVPAYGTIGAAWSLGLGMIARLVVCGVSLWLVWGAVPLRSPALEVQTS